MEPKEKKAKVDQATIDQAWEHFRNYVEDDSVDELQELLLLIPLSSKPPNNRNDGTVNQNKFHSQQDLLPILLSTAYISIAEECMSEYFAIASAPAEVTTSTRDDDDVGAPPDIGSLLEELRSNIVGNIQKSLEYYPDNAMTYSLAANFARTHGCCTNGPAQTARWYLHAAKCSQELRSMAIRTMNDTENPPSEKLKEWLEVLVLNHICGVVDGSTTPADGTTSSPTEDDNKEDEKQEVSWSSSAVEGTARFLAAMMLSTMNRHDEAAQQLLYYPQLTHRIHPNVWRGGGTTSTTDANTTSTTRNNNNNNKNGNVPSQQCPVSFATPVLPPTLYAKLCQVFDKDASYWLESDYDARGYYSYFVDLPKDHNKPTNAIEEAVLHYLLPRVRQHLGEDDDAAATASSIVGYEWWVHTRPVSASLGHNLHFDTDEAKLAAADDSTITHPRMSAVLYLTAPPISGATVIFQQTPVATENASCAWYSQPADNSLMVFPGNMLHGVLPCRPAGTFETDTDNIVFDHVGGDANGLLEACGKPPPANSSKHRLSFMVGFWTRRVPDEMKERELYGPCGPLPSPDEADWVKQLQVGYDAMTENGIDVPATTDIAAPTLLPCVTPAWEAINTTAFRLDDGPGLQVPRAIDHHFFVTNAPGCFRDSLFETNDEDDDPCIIDMDEEDEEDFSDEEDE